MRTTVWTVIAALLIVPTPAVCDDGLLQSIRDSVRAEAETDDEPKEKKKKKHNSSGCEPCDHDGRYNWGGLDDAFGTIIWGGTVFVLGAPFWIPATAVEGEPFGFHGDFNRYPYADGYDGMMGDGFAFKTWTGRIEGFNSNNFDQINQTGGHLLIESAARVGIETRWAHLQENFPNSSRDQAVIGDANLLYRFAQNERIMMRVGAGMRTFLDDGGSEFGLNLTYGADVFLVDPVVVTSTFDYAKIGSANLFESRSTIGVMLNRFELFTGYEFLRISTTNIHGMLGGVRIWF